MTDCAGGWLSSGGVLVMVACRPGTLNRLLRVALPAIMKNMQEMGQGRAGWSEKHVLMMVACSPGTLNRLLRVALPAVLTTALAGQGRAGWMTWKAVMLVMVACRPGTLNRLLSVAEPAVNNKCRKRGRAGLDGQKALYW